MVATACSFTIGSLALSRISMTYLRFRFIANTILEHTDLDRNMILRIVQGWVAKICQILKIFNNHSLFVHIL